MSLTSVEVERGEVWLRVSPTSGAENRGSAGGAVTGDVAETLL